MFEGPHRARGNGRGEALDESADGAYKRRNARRWAVKRRSPKITC